jgi:hypothetical protein
MNTQTQSNIDMTIGNKRSRNVMQNHDTSIMETKITMLTIGSL